MKNYIQKGEIIDFINTSGTDIQSGDVVIQNSIIGVAETLIAAGTSGAVVIMGVVQLALIASLAVTAGDKVYWNVSSKVVTKTTSDVLIGFAVTTQAANDPTVNVKLNLG